jgi:hypothetical protein
VEFAEKPLPVRVGRANSSADLGGSSEYSSGNLEG